MADCILWQGWVHPNGYGRSGSEYVHRIAWQEARGEIPPRMHVHHLCRVKTCINVEHLELLTPEAHAQLPRGERVPVAVKRQKNREACHRYYWRQREQG